LIEHHMKVVMSICDRLTVLDYGEKLCEGHPEAVRNDQKVIEAYLGTKYSVT
jgi:branched-chain amino acid transport system ATP-binding protein